MNLNNQKLGLMLVCLGAFISFHPLHAQVGTFPFGASQISPATPITFNIDSTYGTLLETAPVNSSPSLSFSSGNQMIWIPALGAFRAGGFVNTQLTLSMTGQFSTALGYSTVASGFGSTALGDGTSATNSFTLAAGFFSSATNLYAVAMGLGAQASGVASTALNYGTKALGSYSTSAGVSTSATAVNSFAIGTYNTGLGEGGASVNSTTPASTDPLFEIGNGTGTGTHASDAFTVYADGTATLKGPLTVTQTGGDIPMFAGY